MLWTKVSKWLYDTAVADTGTGGLFNATTPLITGWFTNEASQDQGFPYVVCTLVSEVENDAFATAVEAVEVVFQFGVYSDADRGPTAHAAVTDRIRTLFRRVAPTISGYTTSQVMLQGSPFHQVTDRALYSVHEARVLLSK